MAESIEQVVAGGMCVGCGGCGVATGGKISLKLNRYGSFEADLSAASAEERAIGSQVCPFTPESDDEDVIAAREFPDIATSDPRVGRYRSLYAGRISDDSQISSSSSGGLTSWLLEELANRSAIEGVIHVGPTDSTPIFAYNVSEGLDEIRHNKKSVYYATTFADVIEQIRGNGRRYAFVGVPCFLRSLRLVMARDSGLKSQIPYLIGIVCGHMKSSAYAESLAWQLGVPPNELGSVDFRIKDPKRTARHYGFGARPQGASTERVAASGSLLGTNWGHAVFQLNACNYCDDVYAETADIVLGDAWLPKYDADWRGTNVVITRDAFLDSVLRDGAAAGLIDLEPITVEAAARAQAGNFRHRHEGLAVRLADDIRHGRWVPEKRIKPNLNAVGRQRRRVIRERRQLSAVSHEVFLEAKQRADLDVYLDQMRPMIKAYDRISRTPFAMRAARRLRQLAWKAVRR